MQTAVRGLSNSNSIFTNYDDPYIGLGIFIATGILFIVRNLIALSQNDQTINERALKQFQKPQTFPSTLPKKVIKYTAKHHWDNVIKIIVKDLDGQECKNNFTRDSSCINTGLACLAILVGKERTKKIYGQIRKFYPNTYKFQKGNSEFNFKVSNLFDNMVIYKINHDKNYNSLPKLEKKIMRSQFLMEASEDFENYFIDKFYESYPLDDLQDPDEIIHKHGEDCLNDIEFNFNSNIINLLKGEMEERLEETSSKKSFVYALLVESGSKQLVDHFLVIVQSHYNTFEIFQSWIIKALLLEDMKKQKLLNYNEMMIYLSNLEKCFSPLLHIENSSRYASTFGYKCSDTPLFSFSKGKFKGISFKVYSEEFDPNDVIPNFFTLTNVLFPNRL